MPVCTKCGTVMHEDAVKNHVCDPADIPAKGAERKPMTTDRVATEVANAKEVAP